MTIPEVHIPQQSPEKVADVEEAIAVATDSTTDTTTTTAAVAVDSTPTPVVSMFERARDAAERAGSAVEKAAGSIADRLRNEAELVEDRGVTTIADEVVEKIAGIAAREVAGVHDLGGEASRVFASLRERVGLGESDSESADNGVKVKLDGTVATIDVTVVIEFGYVVHSVTDAVRTKVISSVENMLGLEVNEVNIRVNDVHIHDGGSDDGAASAA